MITIHQFIKKYFLTEADAPPIGGAPAPIGGPTPPTGGGAAEPPIGASTPPPDLGGLGSSLGGSLGGASTPPPGIGSDLGGSIGGAATGATVSPITDIKKLNAWDLLEKYFSDKVKPKDPLEAYR